jgi:hypothetical protein
MLCRMESNHRIRRSKLRGYASVAYGKINKKPENKRFQALNNLIYYSHIVMRIPEPFSGFVVEFAVVN